MGEDLTLAEALEWCEGAAEMTTDDRPELLAPFFGASLASSCYEIEKGPPDMSRRPKKEVRGE